MEAAPHSTPAGRERPRTSRARETALRTALWLLLGGWLGSWVLFATVIARVTFQVLPSTELAGRVVGPVLEALHLYGAFAGLLLAALARVMHRGVLLGVLPLVLGALCLYSHFGVTAGIAEVRDLAFGGGSAGSEEAAARFTALHQLSMGIFTLVSLGVIALVGLHAHAETRPAAPQRPFGAESGRSRN